VNAAARLVNGRDPVSAPPAQPDEASPRRPHDPPWRSRTAHRSCDPKASDMLKMYRLLRGWSVSEASRRTGVSRRMIGLLERAQRRPSLPLAEALIAGYGIRPEHAAIIRAIALPNVGRDSPYRTGRHRHR
jgi:DNA-binding XRE family transcriptional regulator